MHRLLTRSNSRRFLLIIIGLLLALLLAEIYTRTFLVKSKENAVVSLWQADPFLAQSLKPSMTIRLNSLVKKEFSITVKTNSQGFRDTKIFDIPPP